jgi:hypothetical protein
MVQTKGHNDLYLTLVGILYKREIMVRRRCLWNPNQNIKIEVESNKKNQLYLCSEGGREEHERIHVLS